MKSIKAVDVKSTAFFMTRQSRATFTHIYFGLIVVSLFLFGCVLETYDFSFNWKDNKAVSLNIPPRFEKQASDIQVTLGVEGATPMLGEIIEESGKTVFVPVVPFTRGMHYHIVLNGQVIGEINVPVDTDSNRPELTVYPTSDTVPGNLLKMYLVFTEPMVEGQSLRHIHLLNTNGDTLHGTFLDLKPELWNPEGTRLTLWLDPGRIKRDLIPNQELGNPLVEGNLYTLRISDQWMSKTGLLIKQSYSKSFVVSGRDEQIPNIDSWNFSIPKRDTADSLLINFQEPLDYSLIQSTILILNKNGESIRGRVQVMDDEMGIVFYPWDRWQKGTYQLRVESKLEDLAGNNLSRLFDRDLKKTPELNEKPYYEREFIIQ
jgi:hypothetical protein